MNDSLKNNYLEGNSPKSQSDLMDQLSEIELEVSPNLPFDLNRESVKNTNLIRKRNKINSSSCLEIPNQTVLLTDRKKTLSNVKIQPRHFGVQTPQFGDSSKSKQIILDLGK